MSLGVSFIAALYLVTSSELFPTQLKESQIMYKNIEKYALL